MVLSKVLMVLLSIGFTLEALMTVVWLRFERFELETPYSYEKRLDKLEIALMSNLLLMFVLTILKIFV